MIVNQIFVTICKRLSRSQKLVSLSHVYNDSREKGESKGEKGFKNQQLSVSH